MTQNIQLADGSFVNLDLNGQDYNSAFAFIPGPGANLQESLQNGREIVVKCVNGQWVEREGTSRIDLIFEDLASSAKHEPAHATFFYAKLAEFLADPGDPTGLKAGDLRMLAEGLKIEFTRMERQLERLAEKPD